MYLFLGRRPADPPYVIWNSVFFFLYKLTLPPFSSEPKGTFSSSGLPVRRHPTPILISFFLIPASTFNFRAPPSQPPSGSPSWVFCDGCLEMLSTFPAPSNCYSPSPRRLGSGLFSWFSSSASDPFFLRVNALRVKLDLLVFRVRDMCPCHSNRRIPSHLRTTFPSQRRSPIPLLYADPLGDCVPPLSIGPPQGT